MYSLANYLLDKVSVSRLPFVISNLSNVGCLNVLLFFASHGIVIAVFPYTLAHTRHGSNPEKLALAPKAVWVTLIYFLWRRAHLSVSRYRSTAFRSNCFI